MSAQITVALSPFPNVPNLPGVPQLARSLLFPSSGAPTIATQATSGALFQSAPPERWGVLDQSDTVVIDADSVLDFGYRAEYRISNFPVQDGQFASYNKVTLPFESSVALTKGGSVNDRLNFLAQCDAVAASLDLYTILTPEKAYLNCNVTRVELSRRGVQNANYFDVEMFFIQIISVTPQYSSTSNVTTPTNNASEPSAIPPANQGLTNAQNPTTAVQSQAAAAIAPPNDEVAFLKFLAG